MRREKNTAMGGANNSQTKPIPNIVQGLNGIAVQGSKDKKTKKKNTMGPPPDFDWIDKRLDGSYGSMAVPRSGIPLSRHSSTPRRVPCHNCRRLLRPLDIYIPSLYYTDRPLPIHTRNTPAITYSCVEYRKIRNPHLRLWSLYRCQISCRKIPAKTLRYQSHESYQSYQSYHHMYGTSKASPCTAPNCSGNTWSITKSSTSSSTAFFSHSRRT